MSDVHQYSSKAQRLIILVVTMLALSGCSGTGNNLVSALDPSVSANQQQQIAEPAAATLSPTLSPMTKFVEKATQKKTSKLAYRPLVSRPKSHWCTYLSEDAAAEATILRAPTISGDINDDGRKSATLGYDVVNIARAHLIETTAEAKCRRYQANSALKRITITAPNNLTRAGFAAKAKVINRRSSKLRAIQSLVQRELKVGNLDRSQATNIALAAGRVLADGAKASSEAAKRQGLEKFDMKNVTNLAGQLFKAERDLADINSNIRSTDAVSVNLEGGWREGFVQNGIRVQDDSMFGGVKVSVKLGAFNPLRKSHEAAATRARLRAHRSEPGSVFWKINELISAHQRSRAGLVASKHQFSGARANAARLKANLPAGDPAYLVQRYKAEIEIIKLDAEIAAVNASLRQLDANLLKLRQLSV